MEPEIHRNGVVKETKVVSYSLLKLDKEGVRKFWPTVIRPGLERIKEKDKNGGKWEPEHVRLQLERGLAGTIFCECHLILASNLSVPVGFVVVTLYNDEFINVPLYLHVWLAWCEKAPVAKVRESIDPQLEQIGKDLGVRGIQFGTSRWRAWMHRLFTRGYKIHLVMFRKDFK